MLIGTTEFEEIAILSVCQNSVPVSSQLCLQKFLGERRPCSRALIDYARLNLCTM